VSSSIKTVAVAPLDSGAVHAVSAAETCAADAQSVAPPSWPARRLRVRARSGRTQPARSSSFRLAMCAALIFVCSAPAVASSACAASAPVLRSATVRSALPFPAFVAEASQRFGIPAHWIRAVMRIESGGDPRAVSPVGAMGLMQIMPKTYAELRARHRLGPNAYDPRDNILAGAAYLREMFDRYGSPGFLAAYNAGPLRYDQHLATGRPLPQETRTYVAMLSPMIGGRQVDTRAVASFDVLAWARAALFATRSAHSPNAEMSSASLRAVHSSHSRRVVDLSALSPHSEGLFVRLASRERGQ
jgi:soluble lytic murein transglycosylase-like protein